MGTSEPVKKRRQKKAPVEKPELSTGPVFAAEILQTRLYLGLKKGDFGKLLGGITARSIGRFERGDSVMPTEIGNAMRDVLYPRTKRGDPAPTTPEPEPAPEPKRRRRKRAGSKTPSDARRLVYTIEVYEHIYEEG